MFPRIHVQKILNSHNQKTISENNMRDHKKIYMDHSATTPVRPEVVEAMLPYFTESYGNASSIHWTGRQAGAGLSKARREIAARIGANPNEIIFTGCGTESDNAALRGIALARRQATGAKRIITTPIEHHAILETAEDLHELFGFEVTLVPVDRRGLIRIEDVIDAIEMNGADDVASDVAVVSVMYANNEIGAVQPLAEIGALCQERNIPFHTDAVQAVGKLPLDVNALGVDALSTSAHKFYGPKGVGFLYLRQGTPFRPLLTGGGHEGNRRAGTENVPYIVGMAKALALVEDERPTEMARLRVLRDKLIDTILAEIEGAQLTGPGTDGALRLDNHASFVIRGLEAEGILIGLDLAGIAASSGSACTSGAQRPSHVLEAMNISAADAVGGLRLSLGHSNGSDDVAYVLTQLSRIVENLL